MIEADADPALIGGDVVDAVGNGLAVVGNHEVVHAHFFGLALGPQFAAGVLEVANKLLFLGIDGDGRLAGFPEAADARIDMLELGVATWMLATFARLGIGLQAEAHVLEQASDDRVVDMKASDGQLACQMSLTPADPQQRRLWVAANSRRDQIGQSLEQAGLLDHRRLAATTTAPHPTTRQRLRIAVDIPQPAADRAARKPGRKRHRRYAAASRHPRLAGREQTQATLIEVRGNCFVALANRRSVDHTISVRLAQPQATILPILFLRSSTRCDSFLAIRLFCTRP